MSRLKYIHVFGTSYSNGGGFEFYAKEDMRELYKPLGITLSKDKFKFSYLLEKKLKNIKVINYAKDGFGNERMYRKIFEIISNGYMNDTFVPDQHMFIMEFSDLGRKEVYSPKDKKHGIINYQILDKNNLKVVGHTFDYTTGGTSENLDIIKKNWKSFFDSTFDFQNEIQKIYISLIGIVSYLSVMETHFLITHPSDIDSTFTNHFFDKFKKNILRIGGDSLFVYLRSNNHTIKDETNNINKDGHFSYGANKIICDVIYNKLISMGLINEEYVDINNTINHANELKNLIGKNKETKYI